MWEYHRALKQVLDHGTSQSDRTGAGTTSLFGSVNLEFDLRDGFPIQTTKKVSFKNVAAELLWFLSGDTRVDTLVRQGVNIWNADWRRIQKRRGYSDSECDSMLYMMRAGTPYETPGELLRDTSGNAYSSLPLDMVNLPHIYGEQWRNFHGTDQIAELIQGLKTDPHGRRHIVSAWNASEIGKMALPPCHTMFQFYVDKDMQVSCKMYQRSADQLLGEPYNIASYALLTHLVARHLGYTPHKLFISIGDAHVYNTHLEQVKEVLSRTPRKLPKLVVAPEVTDIFGVKLEHLSLEGYDPYPAIKAPLEVGV